MIQENLFKSSAKREVVCNDAHNWLPENKNNKAIITSLPDMEEVGLEKDLWMEWVRYTCYLLTGSIDDDGIIIFYQTDRKYKGQVIDKKTLISDVFFRYGYKNIFSKIVLKQAPNTVNLYRPSFTNLFGFSRKIKSGKATPDVIDCGRMIYKNAMGENACRAAIEFIVSKIETPRIVDPFCGQGSVLRIANDMDIDAVGVEILQDQVTKAIKL